MKIKKEEIADDWCFVCKDGGSFRVCDHKDCLKVYHPECVGKDASFLEVNDRWFCGRHFCLSCGKISKFQCFCCTKSFCGLCFIDSPFVLIKGNRGFCDLCLKLVVLIEEEKDVDSDGGKVDFRDRSTVEFLFADYWEIIKEREGLTLQIIQSAHANLREGRKVIAEAEHDESHDASDGDERLVSDYDDINNEGEKRKKIKRRRPQAKNNRRVCKKPHNGSNIQQTCFVSMVEENMKLVYLRRSLVEEISKQANTFEDKVVGSFVRVKSDPTDSMQKTSHQLLQVTGIRNNVCSGNIGAEILLQVSLMLKDIPISMLSDEDFSKEECEDLRRKVKDCLHKNITRAEFEKKVKTLHEDQTRHWIARELAVLEHNINGAKEKGWRRELFEYTERRQLLQKPSEQSRLLQEIPEVIGHSVKTEPTSEECMLNGKQVKNVSLSNNLKRTSKSPSTSLEGNGTHCVLPIKVEVADSKEKWHLTDKPSPQLEVKHKASLSEENHQEHSQQSNIDPPPHIPNVSLQSPTGVKLAVEEQVIELSSDEEEKLGVKKEIKMTTNENQEELPIWHCMSPHGEIKGPFTLSILKRWSEASKYALKHKVWKTGESEAEAIFLSDVIHL